MLPLLGSCYVRTQISCGQKTLYSLLNNWSKLGNFARIRIHICYIVPKDNMLQTCDQENAQAEIANKDVGLFFGLKRERASSNFMLRRNISASEKLLHKVFEFTL